MAKETTIKIIDINSENITVVTSSNDIIKIKSFNDGVLIIESAHELNIHVIAKFIAGCFHPHSTFKNVKSVIFDFYSDPIIITAEESSTDLIIKKWRRTLHTTTKEH